MRSPVVHHRTAVACCLRSETVCRRAPLWPTSSKSARTAGSLPATASRRARRALTVLAAGKDDDDEAPVTTSSDWRDFRAALVAAERSGDPAIPAAPDTTPLLTPEQAAAAFAGVSGERLWAHPLAAPEPGCLLLANPKLFLMQQQYFFQSVIFLFQHNADGSAGVILNKPLDHTIKSLVSGDTSLVSLFPDEPVFLGGDVGQKILHILHGMPGLPGATPIVPGVAMGGFEAASALVEAGGAEPSQFRFYTRYCGWGPGQLDNEVLQNVWTPAAASKELVLRAPPAGGPHAMWRQVHNLMGSEPDEWWAARGKASDL